GTLFFAAFDAAHGVELWRSDGTAAGTRLAADVNPGPVGSFADNLTAAVGDLFFTAEDATHGPELWVLDPRPNHGRAQVVRGIWPGAGAGGRGGLRGVNGFSVGPPAGGTLYFTADDGVHGVELWKVVDRTPVSITGPGDQLSREGDVVSLPVTANGGTPT